MFELTFGSKKGGKNGAFLGWIWVSFVVGRGCFEVKMVQNCPLNGFSSANPELASTSKQE